MNDVAITHTAGRHEGATSPGRRFVESCAKDGESTRVAYDVTITDSLLSSRRKPRTPARNVFSVVDLSRRKAEHYWHESPPEVGDKAVIGAEFRREAANRFHKSPIPELYPTTAWVQVPPNLWEEPETFERFINYRLIVRLCTAENEAILKGPGGVLTMDGIARLSDGGDFGTTIMKACNEVEQMGGTADGMIINPADYYKAMARGRLMQDLEENGVFIVRTRLTPEGSAVVGDFGHGAQLFDAGRSVIAFDEPPEGTFARPGLALKAEIYERVIINLPTNFFFCDV